MPTALAARLARRGLLKPSAEPEEVEEVIAEDYDDVQPARPYASMESEADQGFTDETEPEELFHECLACPNRVNPYHVCVDYCKKRWGFKRFKPDPEMAKRHRRLLTKYPPPSGWAEVGDPETGRYYYWNLETDEVSWLPPQHPRASVSLSAERIKELKLMAAENQVHSRDSQGESSDESTDLDDEEDLDDDKEFEVQARSKGKQNFGRKRQREALDPMDPAAYSDVPRGTWSTGLDQRGSAKTGVDVTVSGPLFQQRPYPSPGAVLRMNKDNTKNKEPPKGKEITVQKPS